MERLTEPVLGLGLRKTYYRMRGMHRVAADWAVTACLPPTEVYVVSGFSRSGTTWLQQSLARAIGAKTIFEPFAMRRPGFYRQAQALRTDGLDHQYIPYLDRPEYMAAMKPYLNQVFRGYVDHPRGLTARDSWRDSLRRKLVVKFIRATLSLKGIHDAYGVPVVHVRRHPCAVASSMFLMKPLGFFEEKGAAQALLTPTHAQEKLFGRYREIIERCDAGPAHVRVAGFWSLSERYIEEQLANAPWARIVRYEDLVAEPEGEFAAILDFFGCAVERMPDLRANSTTTADKRGKVPVQQRAEDWRTRMSTTEIDETLAVVEKLFPKYLEG